MVSRPPAAALSCGCGLGNCSVFSASSLRFCSTSARIGSVPEPSLKVSSAASSRSLADDSGPMTSSASGGECGEDLARKKDGTGVVSPYEVVVSVTATRASATLSRCGNGGGRDDGAGGAGGALSAQSGEHDGRFCDMISFPGRGFVTRKHLELQGRHRAPRNHTVRNFMYNRHRYEQAGEGGRLQAVPKLSQKSCNSYTLRSDLPACSHRRCGYKANCRRAVWLYMEPLASASLLDKEYTGLLAAHARLRTYLANRSTTNIRYSTACAAAVK